MSTFTLVHVILSLIGIAAGLVVLIGLLGGKLLARWNSLFLVTTVATSVTGFFFPFRGVTPGIVIGVLSVIALGIAIAALNVFHLAGGWRKTFVITAMLALVFQISHVQFFYHRTHASHVKSESPPFLFARSSLARLVGTRCCRRIWNVY